METGLYGQPWSNPTDVLIRKRNLDTESHQECVHTEDRPCEDTERRQPSESHGERPRKNYQVPCWTPSPPILPPPIYTGKSERNHFPILPVASDHMQSPWNAWILKGNIWRYNLDSLWCKRQNFGPFFFLLVWFSYCFFLYLVALLCFGHFKSWDYLGKVVTHTQGKDILMVGIIN